jgi:hypothetical protein
MSFAAMMVQHNCEQRVQLALALAHRFEAALIGIAGLALRPAFAARGVAIYRDPTETDCRKVAARFEEMGKKFLGILLPALALVSFVAPAWAQDYPTH